MGLSRRAALWTLGGVVAAGAVASVAGYELVDHEVVPGKSRLDHTLGRCDAPQPAASLRAEPGPVITDRFTSEHRRGSVSYAIAYPPGYQRGAALPVCLALHGYTGDGRSAVHAGDYPLYLAGSVKAGEAPFALAGADGGDGYWHPHPADDPLGMLLDEFLPLLGRQGLRVDKVAVAGWSMGGYGALVCGLARPALFTSVVATSPAIFHSLADAKKVNPGAYDSEKDWAAYDVTARAAEFKGLPLRVAVGDSDPFAPAVHTFRNRLPDPGVVIFGAGCHDNTYWAWAAPDQVRAISRSLGR